MEYKQELQKIYSAEIPSYDLLLGKEIVLYGGGSLGSMACNLLQKAGFTPKYVVDKNKAGKINDIEIVPPDSIMPSDMTNALCLVCIATISYNEIVTFLKKLGVKHILHFYTYAYLKFPQMLSNGWTCHTPTPKEKIEIEKVCEALSHDEQSLCHYLQFLWWKLRGIEYVYEKYPVLSGKKYFDAPSMPKLSENETLLDVGCHFGQTIEKFIKLTNNKFNNIYAFEPDLENLKICKKKITDERIIYSEKAVSNENKIIQFEPDLGFASKISDKGSIKIESITIDSLDIAPTIIKLHIEGEELKALRGAKKTIQKHKPILMVLADHNSDGLFKIANFTNELSAYRLFFNLHDYCGNTAIFYMRMAKDEF